MNRQHILLLFLIFLGGCIPHRSVSDGLPAGLNSLVERYVQCKIERDRLWERRSYSGLNINEKAYVENQYRKAEKRFVKARDLLVDFVVHTPPGHVQSRVTLYTCVKAEHDHLWKVRTHSTNANREEFLNLEYIKFDRELDNVRDVLLDSIVQLVTNNDAALTGAELGKFDIFEKSTPIRIRKK